MVYLYTVQGVQLRGSLRRTERGSLLCDLRERNRANMTLPVCLGGDEGSEYTSLSMRFLSHQKDWVLSWRPFSSAHHQHTLSSLPSARDVVLHGIPHTHCATGGRERGRERGEGEEMGEGEGEGEGERGG